MRPVQPESDALRAPLPVDEHLPAIREALARHPSVVVTASPGAGKTTRVPPALLNAPWLGDQRVWVLQPRRLAAKTAALRVAEEMGEEAGGTVGYHFRFEKRVGPATKLIFLTDGMLPPLAQGDPTLASVGCVVLDEFHERSLALDTAFGYLRSLQMGKRPDLKLVVMSATLDATALSLALDECPVVRSEGRLFSVSTQWRPLPAEKELPDKVRAVVREWARPGETGTALVFLPGVPEIRRCERALSNAPVKVESLYGDMKVEDQQRVLRPEAGPRVILTTNVAETSLTVPGVTAVIDSGWTRQARVSEWSGMEKLVTVASSRASADQRLGRAGRLREGVCYRLYSQFEFEHRPPFDLPEIARADLSKTLLDLASLGVADPARFPWFQAPAEAVLRNAMDLLRTLGAFGEDGALSEVGRRMARFPLPPRLSRFLLACGDLSPKDGPTLRAACRLAALLGEEESHSQDLLEDLTRYQPEFQARRLEEQLAERLGVPHGPVGNAKWDSTLLAKALLTAFPDRVAKVRKGDSTSARGKEASFRELVLSNGGSAAAADTPLLHAHEYFVVAEALETAAPAGKGASRTQAKARSLCPIEADWLLDLSTDRLREETKIEWDGSVGRVTGFWRLLYGQLILDEKALSSQELGEKGEDLLYKEALAAGRQAYCDPEALEDFLQRARFVGERAKDFPSFDEAVVESTLRELCRGKRALSELREADLPSCLSVRLSPKDRALLENNAPSTLLLKGGRRVKVHYEAGKPPWIESRIQDFFGMRETPRLGEVPLVLHLLSPANRAQQVTSDLAGFWKNHYPQMRKELGRRYPRHKWPEDPLV